jgi:outer membrane immunogenic protein
VVTAPSNPDLAYAVGLIHATCCLAGAPFGQISNNRTGWTAGGGAEWMFAPHWSVFAEYNFMGFGTQSAAFTACGPAGCDVLSAKANIQDALVGLNYKF